MVIRLSFQDEIFEKISRYQQILLMFVTMQMNNLNIYDKMQLPAADFDLNDHDSDP